jgi:hypothetical protein
MIITGTQIANELRATWPAIFLPWMTDRKFIAPELKEIKAAVKKHSVANLKVIDNICECEDLADQLCARIHWERIELAQQGKLKEEELYSWAFGIVFGTCFEGWDDNHVCNICYTESGLYLIEPQHNRFWIPNSTDDKIIIAKI